MAAGMVAGMVAEALKSFRSVLELNKYNRDSLYYSRWNKFVKWLGIQSGKKQRAIIFLKTAIYFSDDGSIMLNPQFHTILYRALLIILLRCYNCPQMNLKNFYR